MAPPCFAGTGGIFPANNPRRKIQMFGPIESPTSLQQAPTPKTRQTLPSLPSTAGSVSDDTKPQSTTLPLHGVSDQSSNASAAGSAQDSGGDVASFFQLNPRTSTRDLDASASKSDLKLDAQLEASTTASSPKSAAGAPFRFVWHVLDNAGVPMFVGKHDSDLDPTLRRGYTGTNPIAPSAPLNASEQAASTTRTPHKIPESELEGTKNMVDDNDQMP